MKLLIATQNPHKINEIKPLIPNIQLFTLADFHFQDEIEEYGKTIEENSRIKAEFVWKKFGLPTLADDTGLEVKTLNGEPGVHSARYAGFQKNDADNRKKLLEKLLHKTDRTAQFKTVLTYIDQNEMIQFEGIIKGKIVDFEKGNGGFGYDVLFIPEGHSITFGEMSSDQKNAISHRSIALKKFRDFIQMIDAN